MPALKFDEEKPVLTEVAVILQYIADLVPPLALAPVPGTEARYRLQEWLAFIGSEIHKGLSPFFLPELPDTFKPTLVHKAVIRFHAY